MKYYFKIITFICVTLVGLFILMLSFLSYSSAKTSDYFDGCQARVLEHKLDGQRAMDFTDRCMGSYGYHRLKSCSLELYPVSSCYIPRWAFWIK